MSNMPELKMGVVAVSRDCFPESLSVDRRKALVKAYEDKYGTDHVYECPICIVESEIHIMLVWNDRTPVSRVPAGVRRVRTVRPSGSPGVGAFGPRFGDLHGGMRRVAWHHAICGTIHEP